MVRAQRTKRSSNKKNSKTTKSSPPADEPDLAINDADNQDDVPNEDKITAGLEAESTIEEVRRKSPRTNDVANVNEEDKIQSSPFTAVKKTYQKRTAQGQPATPNTTPLRDLNKIFSPTNVNKSPSGNNTRNKKPKIVANLNALLSNADDDEELIDPKLLKLSPSEKKAEEEKRLRRIKNNEELETNDPTKMTDEAKEKQAKKSEKEAKDDVKTKKAKIKSENEENLSKMQESKLNEKGKEEFENQRERMEREKKFYQEIDSIDFDDIFSTENPSSRPNATPNRTKNQTPSKQLVNNKGKSPKRVSFDHNAENENNNNGHIDQNDNGSQAEKPE